MYPRIKTFTFVCGIASALALTGIIAFPYAAHALEVQYPHIPGFGAPQDTLNTIFASGNLGINDVVQFIFALALWLIGLLAFGSLLVFGFMYETSGANPSKKILAKQRFQGTLMGVLILLGFTIILRAVNPELATLGNQPFNFCGNQQCGQIQLHGPATTQELAYTIDIHNTSAIPTNTQSVYPSTGNIYLDAFRNVPIFQDGLQTGNATDQTTREFFEANVDSVVTDAKANNVNPVFTVSVWLVGTVLSSGINPFGCDDPTKTKSFQGPGGSESCFFDYVNNHGGSFQQWISNYCQISESKTLCGNPKYNQVYSPNNAQTYQISFVDRLQQTYDAFFKVGDSQASSPLTPSITQPVP